MVAARQQTTCVTYCVFGNLFHGGDGFLDSLLQQGSHGGQFFLKLGHLISCAQQLQQQTFPTEICNTISAVIQLRYQHCSKTFDGRGERRRISSEPICTYSGQICQALSLFLHLTLSLFLSLSFSLSLSLFFSLSVTLSFFVFYFFLVRTANAIGIREGYPHVPDSNGCWYCSM